MEGRSNSILEVSGNLALWNNQMIFTKTWQDFSLESSSCPSRDFSSSGGGRGWGDGGLRGR